MEQKQFIGQDSMRNLQRVLHELSVQTVFLVRGNKSYSSCGAESLIGTILHNEKIQTVPFVDFSVNPKYEDAERGVIALKASKADCILAVGGGSVMDMAKLIRHFVAEESLQIPLLAVPTTAGTGAEATHFAVVYKQGVKNSIEADDILPDYAFVYPDFTFCNSAYLTACTGFDALAQAFESYWNRNANTESKAYAERAIDLLWNQLPKVVQSPTEDLRREVSEGAYWAGRAINITKTTAPHAFSYAFTSHCGYPHGHAVALTFPFFFGLNLRVDDPIIAHIGFGQEKLVEQMSAYVKILGLTYCGCREEHLEDLLAQVNLQRLKNNPVVVTPEIINQLIIFLQNQ